MIFAQVLFLAAILAAAPAPASAALHTCDATNGGHLQLTGQALGAATFSIQAGNCTAITISSCNADKITFPALTNIAVTILNVVSNLPGPANFISFSATVTGGSVNVDGVTWSVTGSAFGAYRGVHFVGAVSGTSPIALRNIVMTMGISGAAGAVDSYAAHFASPLAGNGSVGSILNCTGNTISGSVAATGEIRTSLCHFGNAISGFEHIEIAGNSLAGVTAVAGANCEMIIARFEGLITLTTSTTSSIVARSNTMSGSTAQSTGNGQTRMVLLHFGSVTGTATQVSSITVDGADMRNCVVTGGSATWARFSAVWMDATMTLTMVNAGRLVINNVWMGGSMTYRATGALGDGAKVLQLGALSGVNEISLTNSGFDSLTITATGASVHAIAYVLHAMAAVAVPTIRIKNNQITGISRFDASGTGANVLVAFAQFDAAVTNLQQMLAKNNLVTPQFTALSALGAVELYHIYTLNSITGSAGAGDSIDVANTGIRGAATATTGYVCVGVVGVATTQAITAIETVSSGGSFINVSVTAGAAFGGTHGTGTVMVQCGAANSITTALNTGTTSTTTSAVTSTTSSTTTSTTTTTTSGTMVATESAGLASTSSITMESGATSQSAATSSSTTTTDTGTATMLSSSTTATSSTSSIATEAPTAAPATQVPATLVPPPPPTQTTTATAQPTAALTEAPATTAEPSAAPTEAPTTTAVPTLAPLPPVLTIANVTTYPPELQEVIAAADTVTKTATTTVAVSSAFSAMSPAAATVAARVGMVQKLVECQLALDTPLQFYQSPTGLEIDLGAPAIRYHLGGIVANLVITLGFLLLSLLYSIAHSALTRKPGERTICGIALRSLGSGRFPGVVIFPYVFFAQPQMGSALVVIIHGNTASALVAVVVLLIALAYAAYVAFVMLHFKSFLCTYRTNESMAEENKQREQKRQAAVDAGLRRARPVVVKKELTFGQRFVVFYESIEGVFGSWLDVPANIEALSFEQREKVPTHKIKTGVAQGSHSFFIFRYGDIHARLSRAWFIIAEIMQCFILGICEALIASISCKHVSYILLPFFVIYLVALFAFRPFSSMKDVVYVILITTFQVLGAIFLVLPESAMSADSVIKNVTIMTLCSLAVATFGSIETLLANTVKFIVAALNSEADAKKAKAADDDMSDDDRADNEMTRLQSAVITMPGPEHANDSLLLVASSSTADSPRGVSWLGLAQSDSPLGTASQGLQRHNSGSSRSPSAALARSEFSYTPPGRIESEELASPVNAVSESRLNRKEFMLQLPGSFVLRDLSGGMSAAAFDEDIIVALRASSSPQPLEEVVDAEYVSSRRPSIVVPLPQVQTGCPAAMRARASGPPLLSESEGDDDAAEVDSTL